MNAVSKIESLELAKTVNHAEFLEPADADPALLAIARQVKRIAFEHNLIVIEKGDNTAASNAALPSRSA